MPACLTPDSYDDWLSDRLAPEELLRTLDQRSLEVADQMVHYEVSKDVNSVRNNGEYLVQPLKPAVG